MRIERKAADRYNELTAQQSTRPEQMIERLYRDQAARLVKYAGKDIPTFLRPQFISRAQEKLIRHTVEVLSGCIEKIVDSYKDSKTMRRWIPFSPEEAAWFLRPDICPEHVTISRLDAFLDGDKLHYLEFNTDSPASVAWTMEHQKVFRALPMMQQLESDFTVSETDPTRLLFEAMMSAFKRSGLAGPPRIIIADWTDVATYPEFEIVQAYFQQRGVPTVIADPRELEFSNGAIMAGDFRANLLYRRVIWRELFAKRDECKALFEARESGEVLILNPFRAKIPGNKACLAVMYHEEFTHLFTREEQQVITNHVPWTTVLEPGPVSFHGQQADIFDVATKYKDNLVLKPLGGYGGKGVHIGPETSQSDWEAVLRQAADGGWCIQELVDIPEEPFPIVEDGTLSFAPRKLNLNPFSFGGKYAGCFARVSESSIINVSAGGGMIPTFVVGD